MVEHHGHSSCQSSPPRRCPIVGQRAVPAAKLGVGEVTTGSYWRNIAAPIIVEVIARVGRDDERALRKALHDAYPFGERRMHPYKIWCDEVRRQLEGRQHRKSHVPPEAPGQMSPLDEAQP